MTKGEHTYVRMHERTYVRAYVRDKPYIPSTTSAVNLSHQMELEVILPLAYPLDMTTTLLEK